MANGNYEIQTEPVRKDVGMDMVQMCVELWEEAWEEGKVEGKAEGVLSVLEARGLSVPVKVRERVLASRDLDELERWLRRAAVVTSAREIFTKPR